jgi:hypothetical protein
MKRWRIKEGSKTCGRNDQGDIKRDKRKKKKSKIKKKPTFSVVGDLLK